MHHHEVIYWKSAGEMQLRYEERVVDTELVKGTIRTELPSTSVYH